MAGSDDIAIATIHCIVFVVNILGNSLVCAIIKRNKDMRYTKINHVILLWHIDYSTKNPCLTTFPNTAKRAENTAFLTNLEQIGNVVKHLLEYLIYLLNRDFKSKGETGKIKISYPNTVTAMVSFV